MGVCLYTTLIKQALNLDRHQLASKILMLRIISFKSTIAVTCQLKNNRCSRGTATRGQAAPKSMVPSALHAMEQMIPINNSQLPSITSRPIVQGDMAPTLIQPRTRIPPALMGALVSSPWWERWKSTTSKMASRMLCRILMLIWVQQDWLNRAFSKTLL
jgi:hypothetical protein